MAGPRRRWPALATVVLNNLPAASLLAARAPSHPFSLLVGLNLGPNLCVTGLAGLAAVAARGARRGRAPVGAPGQRAGPGGGAAVDGARAGRADPDRRRVTGGLT